jgi:hypothetical protein
MSVRFDGAYRSEQTRSRSNVNAVAVPNIPPKKQSSKPQANTQRKNPSVIMEISSKGKNKSEASNATRRFDKGDFFRGIHKAIEKREGKGINQKPVDPVYRLSAVSQSANEGTNAEFVLTTANVRPGTQLNYTISGVTSADIQGGTLSGSITVDDSGRASISVGLLNDNLTEGSETLSISIASQTSSTIINDTSTTPSPRALTQADITNPLTQFYWDPANGGNGHIYEFVNTDVTWNQALDLAANKSIAGEQGYLVTVTSQNELSFIGQYMNKISVGWDARDVWIALSDQNTEGTWQWMAGPELGTSQDLRTFGFPNATYSGWQTYVDWMSITTGYGHNTLGFQPLDQDWFKGGARTGLNSSVYSRSFYGNGYIIEYGNSTSLPPSPPPPTSTFQLPPRAVNAGTLTEPFKVVPGQGYVMDNKLFFISQEKFSQSEDINSRIKSVYGQKARLAQWEEVKTGLLGKNQDTQNFLYDIGLPVTSPGAADPNLFVTRNGGEFDGGRGRWFITNFSGTNPSVSNYAAFDSVNSSIYLGSYYWPGQALVVIDP